MEGGREGGRQAGGRGREGGGERGEGGGREGGGEGGREEGREGGRRGGKERKGGREGGKEGGKAEEREGGREQTLCNTDTVSMNNSQGYESMTVTEAGRKGRGGRSYKRVLRNRLSAIQVQAPPMHSPYGFRTGTAVSWMMKGPFSCSRPSSLEQPGPPVSHTTSGSVAGALRLSKNQ